MRRSLLVLTAIVVTAGLPLAATAQEEGGKSASDLMQRATDAVKAIEGKKDTPEAAAKEAAPEPTKPTDEVNNPAYAQWSQFAVGASVTQSELVELADGTTVEVSITSKLLSKSQDQVSVETTVERAGAGAKAGLVEKTVTTTVYPAKTQLGSADSPEAAYSVTEGTELVDVQGKQVEAEWVEATSTDAGVTTVDKVWTVRDVPGGIVKQTLTRKQGDKKLSSSTRKLVSYQAKMEQPKQEN